MGKQSITTELAALGGLSLKPGSMGRQLAARLREAIETGQLCSGDRLPASRTLARKLELARGTVADVYSQLVTEGYLESRVGAGTYVARDLGPMPFAAIPRGIALRRADQAVPPHWPKASPPFHFPKHLEKTQADMPPNAKRFAALPDASPRSRCCPFLWLYPWRALPRIITGDAWATAFDPAWKLPPQGMKTPVASWPCGRPLPPMCANPEPWSAGRKM